MFEISWNKVQVAYSMPLTKHWKPGKDNCWVCKNWAGLSLVHIIPGARNSSICAYE